MSSAWLLTTIWRLAHGDYAKILRAGLQVLIEWGMDNSAYVRTYVMRVWEVKVKIMFGGEKTLKGRRRLTYTSIVEENSSFLFHG